MLEGSSFAIDRVARNARRSLVPPPRVQLSAWIERELRLPEGVSALPGRVRLWGPQRGIADAIGDPTIERVTIVKPVRVGFTTLLSAALASYIANEPSPILALLPTEADARDYVVSDLEPIFEATPILRGLLSAEADDAGRNTLLSRRFPGGSLKIVAAKSPRNLRRHNVRVLLIDEADAMETGAEGSPITLAERRTLSFPNRKIILGSTPTLEETSNVLRSYGRSDQRVFEVPCPECGNFHELSWADIQWPDGVPSHAHYVCPACGCVVEERHKVGMIDLGRWRITRPDVEGHAGFRLNALVSTLANASWGKLATEFVAAKKHPDQLQTFVNTILAQGWREAAEELDESELASRSEPFGLDAIPAEVLWVTVGIDLQHDRAELVFLGHGRDDTVFVLASDVVWGSPEDDTFWAEVDDALRSSWEHPAGARIAIDAVAIDAGDGAFMDRVIAFARPRFGRRIVAIKGAPGNRPAIAASKTRGSRLFIIGVDGLKASLVNRISRGKTIRFGQTLDARFYEELTAERLKVGYRHGAPYRVWERIPGRRAEALDATIYGLAVRGLIKQNPDRRVEELSAATFALDKSVRQKTKSSWMQRGVLK